MDNTRPVKPHGRRRGVSAIDRQATMQGRQQQDELRTWERDWRVTIQGQVDETARTLSDVAGVVRSMQSDVRELMEWKRGIEDRKDQKIDRQPDNRRADFALIVSVVTALIYLLPHLRF